MKLLIGALLLASAPLWGATCESLTSLSLPDTTITLAQPVSAGAFTPPGRTFGGTPAPEVAFKDLPAFCRVAATLKPSADSDIKIEVWLPASGWNRRFEAVGNGGWAGVISYGAMAEALYGGYATASTDTGHVGGRGSFSLGHPQKLIDFGYRSVHEMTVKAKAIVAAYYGAPAKFSYWNGCSTGGRQGLKEAQQFPDDYDGIIAGSSANPRTRISSWQIWLSQVVLDPHNHIPPSKYAVIHRAALQACDAADGLKDGLIEDPTRCHFDPKTIECKGGDAPDCLTSGQVAAVERMYATPENPRTGERIYFGLEPGSELGWGMLARGPEPFSAATDQFRYVVYKNPQWDWRTFDIASGAALADKIDHDTINATDPNINPFVAHGGKLLMYHGWADPGVPPLASVDYYKRAVDTMGQAKAADSIRLFMAPGMGHCGGGDGPNIFDTMIAMTNWRKRNQAPTRVVASQRTNGKVVRTRPLCAYPEIAKYRGSGSIDDAANFVCAAPK